MDKNTKHNMEYLRLNKGQYKRHCDLMKTPMNQYPPKLQEYMKIESEKSGVCGDAIACWVTDYVRGDVK